MLTRQPASSVLDPHSDRAVLQLDRLVLDRSKDPLRQPAGRRPRARRIVRSLAACPTSGWGSGRPCRTASAAPAAAGTAPDSSRDSARHPPAAGGHLNRRRPGVHIVSRDPDPDVLRPFACPPNQAATRPSFVSAIVEAWQEAKGAFSKMNSELTTATRIPCSRVRIRRRCGCAAARFFDVNVPELHRVAVVLETDAAARGDAWELRVVDDGLAVQLDREAVALHRDEEAVPLAGPVVGADFRGRGGADRRRRFASVR